VIEMKGRFSYRDYLVMEAVLEEIDDLLEDLLHDQRKLSRTELLEYMCRMKVITTLGVSVVEHGCGEET